MIIARMVGDRAYAEELASEVFWRLYRQHLPADRSHNLAGWLYRAAVTIGIDALRAVSRRKRYEEAAAQTMIAASNPVDPYDQLFRAERAEQVRVALAHMKPLA